MTAIICLASIIVGLMIGFPLGFLLKKQVFEENFYDVAFEHGYNVAKNNFFNPEAKG